MTQKELKTAIDSYIGIKSTLASGKHTAKLLYQSPTGIPLFIVNIFDRDGWYFGGIGSPLPESWQILCLIHKKAKSNE